MVKIEDVEVMGMRKAIKGMRNALNSWDKSDSEYGCLVDENDWVNKEKYPVGYVTKCKDCTWCEPLCYDNHDKRTFIIGEGDIMPASYVRVDYVGDGGIVKVLIIGAKE